MLHKVITHCRRFCWGYGALSALLLVLVIWAIQPAPTPMEQWLAGARPYEAGFLTEFASHGGCKKKMLGKTEAQVRSIFPELEEGGGYAPRSYRGVSQQGAEHVGDKWLWIVDHSGRESGFFDSGEDRWGWFIQLHQGVVVNVSMVKG